MNIKELLGSEYCINEGKSKARKVVEMYKEENCVVAYLKENIGITFIIKSDRKFFAFCSLKRNLIKWINEFYIETFDRGLAELDLKTAEDIIAEDKNTIVLDRDLYLKIKKKLVLENLKDKYNER